jgi:hypothetical protein
MTKRKQTQIPSTRQSTMSEIEENNITCYLDLAIHRKNNRIELNIHRKPIYIDVVINFTSNHPLNHKLAAFHYYIDRLNNLPIIKAAD